MSNHSNEIIKEQIYEQVMNLSVQKFQDEINNLDESKCQLAPTIIDAEVLKHRRQVSAFNSLILKLVNKLYEEYEND